MTNLDTDDAIQPMKEAVRDNLNELRVAPGGGALVSTFAQQVDYAKQMSRGKLSLPDFLAGNVGDCLAVVGIAYRYGFDPYMVAGQTYVQSGRLCYMAQIVHAMIECSGRLSRRLRVDYEGEGDERRCIVTGWVKGESEPFVLKSETLGSLRPPPGTTHIDKNNVETKSVKGSPLWIKKPDLQLFYNTSRDWARMFLPEVLMGVYTPDEIEETPGIGRGPDGALDRGAVQIIPPTHERLRTMPASGDEGGSAAHVDTELDNIAAGSPSAQGEPKPDAKPDAKPEPEKEKPAAEKKPAKPAKPKTTEEWEAAARQHISEATDMKDLRTWWEGEDKKLRDKLGVHVKQRSPVEDVLLTKLADLKGGGK